MTSVQSTGSRAATARRRRRYRSNILSINFNHDGAGVILSDGAIAAFVATERFSRKKKHPGLRDADLSELLEQAGLDIGDFDHVFMCNLRNIDTVDIPLLHGSDLQETWFPFAFDAARKKVTIRGRQIPCSINPEHHLLHSATAFYSSPFQSAVIFSADPAGCAAYVGSGSTLRRLPLPISFIARIGYTLVSSELFGSGLLGAGKVMGLAPYGAPARGDEGVDYRGLSSMDQLDELCRRDPILVREGDRLLNASMAYHIQRALEVQLTDVLVCLRAYCDAHGIAPNLCLSGGTALNSVANQIAFQS